MTSTEESPSSQWVANGYSRDVWKILEYNLHTKLAFKTIRYAQRMDRLHVERHRKDAVAQEVLTSSPYIANIYGFCVHSTLHDFSDSGDLWYNVKQKGLPTKEERLNIAYRLAASVADAHHFDEHGRATMVHTDIKPQQWIMINGEYQLNDFNRNEFLSWNTERNTTNKFRNSANLGKWRSPEEYSYEDENEKIDVWSLGLVLFFLLTGEEPFQELLDMDALMTLVKQQGKYPHFRTKSRLRSKHPFDVAMLKAMAICFIKDPDERANAQQVKEVFGKVLYPPETTT